MSKSKVVIDQEHYKDVSIADRYQSVTVFRAKKLPSLTALQLCYFDLMTTHDGSIPSQELLEEITETTSPDNLVSYGKCVIPTLFLKNEFESIVEKLDIEQVYENISSYVPHDGMPDVSIYKIDNDKLFTFLKELEKGKDKVHLTTMPNQVYIHGVKLDVEDTDLVIPAWIEFIEEEESKGELKDFQFYFGVHGDEFDIPDFKKVLTEVYE